MIRGGGGGETEINDTQRAGGLMLNSRLLFCVVIVIVFRVKCRMSRRY